MSLEFKPPFSVESYINRPNQGLQVLDSASQLAQMYYQQKQHQQQQALLNRTRDLAEFGAISKYLPPDQIASYARSKGINLPAMDTSTVPQQGQQLPVDAQGNPITGPVQGPALPGVGMGMAAQQKPQSGMGASPVIAGWAQFNAQNNQTEPNVDNLSENEMERQAKILDIKNKRKTLEKPSEKPLLPVAKYSALQSGSAEDLAREFHEGIPGEYVSPALMSTSRNTRILQDPGTGAITRVPVAGAPGPVGTPGAGGGIDLSHPDNSFVNLRNTAPKLADRFTKIVDDAYPDNNPILRTSVEATTASAGVKTILQDKNPSQVGLQSLGFYFARMSGSNSQLSDAERTQFEAPLSLIDKVVNKGYRITKGDLSPKMKEDLSHLADIITSKSKIQGQMIIDAQKRRAKMELGQLYNPGLETQFPSMDRLSVGSGDIQKAIDTNTPKSVPYSDADKEARYQAWKAKQVNQ